MALLHHLRAVRPRSIVTSTAGDGDLFVAFHEAGRMANYYAQNLFFFTAVGTIVKIFVLITAN